MGWWNDDVSDRDCGCAGGRDRHDHDRHDHHWHDHDWDDWDDCGCHDHDRHHRRRRAIPIGEVTVDCTPVTFRTKGQAFNLVTCPKSFFVPGPGGVPCVATVNTPPQQIPVLPIDRRKQKCGCA
ncbi:hypothetical protein J2Z79_001798 [Symbiobacterium terraclitae]|uniref:Uncharacterized protein n=1 Tax=Symbiobacterium terraclitae TaxID=557451 RepID=A0ABS4JTZ2_9FIRM|nr:hypothetical protein [Symbiobacterium terraclitae]MBP2018390.1 hypothetical protein [Symbiobacterium terraclitae]